MLPSGTIKPIYEQTTSMMDLILISCYTSMMTFLW